MMWAPIRHLEPHLSGFLSTADAADWACSSPEGLAGIGYVREVFEMLIGLTTDDTRLTYIKTAEKLAVAKLLGETPDQLVESLLHLNVKIAGFGLDDWMLPAARDDQARWQPITHLTEHSSEPLSSSELSVPPSVPDLKHWRDVLSMAVRMKASDPRANFLSAPDRDRMAVLVGESPAQLFQALRAINSRIREVGLDKRMDVTAAVLGSIPGDEGTVE